MYHTFNTLTNYLATILTKLPQRYSVLYQPLGFIVCCSYVSFVCILCFYPVALCIVVFCCFPLLAVGDILSASTYFWAVFSVWGFVPPLVFEALFSFCWGFVLILYQGFVLVFILRPRPHIWFWGFVLELYWGFVLIFDFEASSSYYIEALSSYFILRLRSRILFWGFVLTLYIEALSSHILFRGFVLIFYIEASFSLFYIEAMFLSLRLWFSLL